jgi:hypothetical protein
MQQVSAALNSVLNGLSLLGRCSPLYWFSPRRLFEVLGQNRGEIQEKPLVVRKGTVAKRRELIQTLFIGSARFGVIPPQIPLVLLHIDCSDELGKERLIVLVEKENVDSTVEPGCSVIVTAQQSRHDSSYAYRSVRLNEQ